MYLQKGISIKLKEKYYYFDVLQVTEEKSSIQSRIRIRLSGSQDPDP
jgi:hypothetical protein